MTVNFLHEGIKKINANKNSDLKCIKLNRPNLRCGKNAKNDYRNRLEKNRK